MVHPEGEEEEVEEGEDHQLKNMLVSACSISSV